MFAFHLKDGWRAADIAPGAELDPGLHEPEAGLPEWLDMSVPGDVHAALVRAGRMPDPHIADNARRCCWTSGRDWVMRREFCLPSSEGAVHELVLDGVDGTAQVFLNGLRLGRTDNAFRPWRFDVSSIVRLDAPNVLLLRFESIDGLLGGEREDELRGWGQRRTWLRKPQFNFGWDWALPLPGTGIMGAVCIESHAGPRLVHVAVRPFIDGRVDFDFEVNAAARDADYALRLRVVGHGADIAETVSRSGRLRSYTTIRIDEPALWWPNGMGEQALYDYEVELLVDGKHQECRCGRFGIREVRTFEEPFTPDAGPGRSFWFEVNGRRVFIKGANWIPQEIWPAEATDDQTEFHLTRTRDAHFNMLRIWGGGVYESERFYDLCDELGIMVWQDFMFASAGYSVDRLRDSIIAEATYQIRRLRNRPCIAIWCGINEDVFSWSANAAQAAGMSDTGVYNESDADSERTRLHDDPILYTMILRGLVSKHALGVPYLESSPQAIDDFGNTPESGNCHISCWKHALFNTGEDYEKWRGHFEAVCSFDSEFCTQGPSDEATMRAFLTDEHTWPPDDVWTYHIQRGHRNLTHWDQTMRIAGATFGEIDSLHTYVKHGQATHLEQTRAEYESARRDRPNNGGTMVWMFNDCWPTSNWSFIDYYGRPKPAYYAARRACAPLLPIIFERAGRIGFFLSNDRPDPVRDAQITFGAARLNGERIWEKSLSLSVDAMDTVRFSDLSRDELTGAADAFLFIDAVADGDPLPSVTWFPNGWKDVPWPEPNLEIEVVGEDEEPGGGFRTDLSMGADTYARLVHLRLPESAGSHWVEDNYFDLTAGGRHTVVVHSAQPFDAASLRVGHWLRWLD